MFKKDELYALPVAELVDFSFDEKTVSVFPDMINRSVPGYSLMQSLMALVAQTYVTENSRVYDLGCSLGASSMALINSVQHDEYKLILVDQSSPMIDHCRVLFSGAKLPVSIEFLQQDIRTIVIENASMVMLNLVLQFLPSADRLACIERIYAGLNSHGVLVISEKIKTSEQDQSVIEELYLGFKKRSGYSDLEISQKRQALEKVMQIDSIAQHIDRLKQVGFSSVIPISQALNFISLLAIK